MLGWLLLLVAYAAWVSGHVALYRDWKTGHDKCKRRIRALDHEAQRLFDDAGGGA